MLDFTEKVLVWLCETHEVTDETAIVMGAGLLFGLALANRHPAYAAAAHGRLGEDYRTRIAGSRPLYDAVTAALGDSRTSPEIMADELVEACPLAT
jgi:hypothetical protein